MATRFFSASELAELKLPALPGSRQKCSQFIAGVRQDAPDLVQPRSAAGGGYVVNIAALPQAAREELARREATAVLAGREQVLRLAPAERPQTITDLARTADDIEADKRQIAARVTGHLTARQRLVMEARATILLAVDAMAVASGIGKDAAIRTMLDDAARGTLSAEQTRVFTTANDKAAGVRVSRASIYRWFAAPVIDLDGERARAAASVIAALDVAGRRITSRYPATEVASWPLQDQEARAVIHAGAQAADVPLIASLAGAFGISLAEMAGAVLAKAGQYREVVASIIATRDSALAAIEAATDVAAITAAEAAALSAADQIAV